MLECRVIRRCMLSATSSVFLCAITYAPLLGASGARIRTRSRRP